MTLGHMSLMDTIDLGSRYTSRVTANMDVTRLDYVNLFDDAEGLFDDRQGLFDGGQSVDDTTVSLFVALTNDDQAGTPAWSGWKEFVVGDYTARALKFKADLQHRRTGHASDTRTAGDG